MHDESTALTLSDLLTCFNIKFLHTILKYVLGVGLKVNYLIS
jgi:hypothetical protein